MLYVTAASRVALKFYLDMKLMMMFCMSVRRLVLPTCDWVVYNVMYFASSPCARLILALSSSIANLIGNPSLHSTTVGVSLRMRVMGFR